MRRLATAVAMLMLLSSAAGAAPEDDPHYRPVKAVGPLSFTVGPAGRSGVLRYFSTGTLDGSATATRAIVNIHGLLRNADVYEKTGEAAIAAANAAADTLLITPQFLTEIDVRGDALPPETLAWNVETWIDGSPAGAPAPIGAFDVLDAIAARLADKRAFPKLREIVFLGHSAGGQLIDRYAVVGHGPERAPGVDVRYVIANPSSYLYFDATRPVPDASCANFNRWKFGFDGGVPPYVNESVTAYEARFVQRRVTYLLGQADIDPHQAVLDRTCMAETQGAYRLARGHNFADYLKARHPEGTRHDVAEVAGVGHDGDRMFTSTCGIEVIFDRPRTDCARNAKI
jgi:hypothetical protein